jgi:hypothetical protein
LKFVELGNDAKEHNDPVMASSWRSMSIVEDLDGPTCSEADRPEKGHKIKAGTPGAFGNKAYHVDGYYIRAAACYIWKSYKNVG